MKIKVYLDSCTWDYFHCASAVLSELFPAEQVDLFITREVEIELAAIPDIAASGDDKRPLKQYIERQRSLANVRTTYVFGFASIEPDGSLSPVQVNGGFGQGAWQSTDDRDWLASNDVKAFQKTGVSRRSGLKPNQSDTSLAVRSFDSVVVTAERPTKKGPLRLAGGQGGAVLHLQSFEGMDALRMQIEAFLDAQRSALSLLS